MNIIKRYFYLIVVLGFFFSYILLSQTVINGGRTLKGIVDNSGATHTLPSIVVANVGALPGSGCNPGELAMVTSATIGQQIYENSGSGACVWTQQLNTGSGTVNTGTANQMAFYAANGTTVSGEGLTSGCNLIAGTTSFIGPTFQSVTVPSAGSFSWLTTQGTATEVATCTNALLLKAPQTVGQTLRMRGLALSPNTTLTVGMTCGAEAKNFRNCGMGFRESATGKLEILNISFGTSTTNIQVERWTNPTTFSATEYPGGPVGQFGILWLRIKVTGGNIFFYTLPDGVNQVQVYTEASNAFFTTAPDQWGYLCGSSTDAGGDACYATLYSFLTQ